MDSMIEPEGPKRRRLNADQRRALKAATVSVFVQRYGRRAQRGVEPNDRRYSREVEKALKQLKPEELDSLMRDDEEWYALPDQIFEPRL
jgi:hypothetical protein